MNWHYDVKENIVGLQCTNPYNYKHILRLSPNNKNLIKEEYDNVDTRYILIKVNNIPTIEDIKKHLLSLQQEYDNCYEVNSFYINNKRCWFDKATRVGLVNAINLQKQLGNTTYKIWFGNEEVELDIDRALTLLANIENYASECYNITQKHITEINNLSTLDGCLKYDITAGYPSIFIDLGLEGLSALDIAKRAALKKIDDYDQSPNVNSFFLNGKEVWLNKDTRVGLMNSLNIEKNSGKEESALWFDNMLIVINCDAAILMLSALELYALECYNKTAEHKKNIEGMESVEDITAYDYTEGYPAKLSFTI